MRPGLLAALLLLGCPAKKPAAPAMPDVQSLTALAPPPSEVHYTRINVASVFDLPPVPIRETWLGPSFEAGRVVYDVHSENFETGRTLDITRVFYGPEGYGYLGTVMKDGTLQTWDPPQIVLPPGAKVGDAWTGEHHKGAQISARSCEILPPEGCDGGMVVVCESKRADGVIVLRDHFCPGHGWSGFEALVQVPNQPAVRMWSEGVRKDGLAAPSFDPPQPEPAPAPPAPGEPPPPPG